MTKRTQTLFLVSFAAVFISCDSEKALAPEPPPPQREPEQPQPSSTPIKGVVVTAASYTALVGSSAQMTVRVYPENGVQYTVEWSLTGGTNTATIDAKTGVLNAVASGLAYPRACATTTLSNGQAQTVCDETSIRIITPATLFPNGSLAFVHKETIFVSGSDGSDPVALITGAARPAWSPDGARLAFARQTEYQLAKWQICIANPDGSNIRCATGASNGRVLGTPSWSPDGAMIAFSTFNYECPNGGCGQLGGNYSGLLILNTLTMKVESLNIPAVKSAAWSPDGRKIAVTIFGVGTFGRGALATVNPDGSGFNILAHSLGTYSVTEVSWSPDGGRLALSLQDEHACPRYCDTAIGITNADATQLKVLDRARTCFESACLAEEAYIVGTPRWVDNGTRVAYTIVGGECYQYHLVPCAADIAVARPDNGSIETLITAAGFPSWRQ